MVNAPPTPPPTSPRELLDEARGNAMETVVAADPSTSQQVHPHPKPEHYGSVIQALKNAIANNDHRQAMSMAETFNLNTTLERSSTRLIIVAPLILGYLIEDNLQPARFVLSKLPESLQGLPVTRGLSDLLLFTINREHAKVYQQCSELVNALSKADFPDRDLADLITGLLPGFLNAFRERTFRLLSKAYSSLSLPLASVYLGMPAEQLISAAQSIGWSYDATTQIFQPKIMQPKGTMSQSSSSLTAFELVADSVAQLEA